MHMHFMWNWWFNMIISTFMLQGERKIIALVWFHVNNNQLALKTAFN